MHRILIAMILCSTALAQDKPKVVPVPVAGRLLAVGQTQTLSGSEFEFFNLTGYASKITWDATLPDGSTGPLPVKFFEVKSGQPVIGLRVGTDLPEVHLAPDGSTVAVFATGNGRVAISAWGVVDGQAVKISTLMIQASTGPRPPPVDPPLPVDPAPPRPVDPPKPVDPPVPMPTPAITGVRVLIVYESAAALNREQLNIVNSTQIRAYLNEKCVKTNNQPEWRRWDKSTIDITGLTNETQTLQQLWKDVSPALTTLPRLVIAVNGKATVHDLPATEADTLALLKKTIEGK